MAQRVSVCMCDVVHRGPARAATANAAPTNRRRPRLTPSAVARKRRLAPAPSRRLDPPPKPVQSTGVESSVTPATTTRTSALDDRRGSGSYPRSGSDSMTNTHATTATPTGYGLQADPRGLPERPRGGFAVSVDHDHE